MEYYHKPEMWRAMYGRVYCCDHELYNRCTLYDNSDGLGLAVIQQRFNPKIKRMWWDAIDPWLTTDVYLNPTWPKLFKRHAGLMDIKGCFPTITIRQTMAELGMPPMMREPWERVDYCEHDADVLAKEILAKLTGMGADDTIDQLTKELIFGVMGNAKKT